MSRYIAIDIGGTQVKYGILDGEGRILESFSRDTEAHLGGKHILETVKTLVSGFLSEYAGEIAGICLSSAGMVDVEAGRIFHSGPQIPDYAGIEFKKELERSFGLPCEIENDVNCAGLSESMVGAARDAESCLCLTVGTGIGGTFVLHKEVYHGFSGSACEVGYMHLPGGNFETLGAASALVRRVAEKKGEPAESWNGLRVFELAKQGDSICAECIEEICDVLGMGIANLCYALNPEVVVLGGGIMQQRDYLYPRIRAALDKYLLPAVAEKTRLAMAENGNHAGMLGAFWNFRKMQEKR